MNSNKWNLEDIQLKTEQATDLFYLLQEQLEDARSMASKPKEIKNGIQNKDGLIYELQNRERFVDTLFCIGLELLDGCTKRTEELVNTDMDKNILIKEQRTELTNLKNKLQAVKSISKEELQA